MDYYTILSQCSILRREIAGRRIETIRIKDKFNLFIGFEGDQAIKLSSVPDMPYIISIEKRFIPIKNAHTWFPKYFHGQEVIELSITHSDRILTFYLDSGVRLIFEMTGRHANIIIVDHEGVIAGAVRKVTRKDSSVRTIRPGVLYMPPPVREFPDIVWAPLPALERLLKSGNDNIVEALRRTLCSGSRLFALEALALAGINPAIYPVDLNPDDTFHLFKMMATLETNIEQGGSGATIVFSKDGLPQDVFPMKMTAAYLPSEHMDDLNGAVKKYAREREIMLERRSLQNSIIAALNRKEQSIKSTIMKIERERGDESEPELLERKGNTVLANIHNITKGMKSAVLVDPYGSGEIEVELNPTLDGPANARRFFSRAKKLRSASKISEERFPILRNRLEKIKIELGNVANIDEIKVLKKIAARYVKFEVSSQVLDIDEKFPRRFKSISGLDIIIGRNDKENDELVRWARKNDLWLHAQNIGGSHVILRSPGKQSPDHKSVEQAAAIAAYYSKARTSAVVPVACTQVKYVVKRKGQVPGKVTYTREKVIFAQPGIPEKNVGGQ